MVGLPLVSIRGIGMKWGFTLIKLLVFIAIIAPSASAYIPGICDTKSLLEDAELVCHVRVLSATPCEVEKDASSQTPSEIERGMAKVAVVNVIKGKCADKIDVLFLRLTQTEGFAELTKGDECILFLRVEKGHYRLVNDHCSKLDVPRHEAIKCHSHSFADRLVAELVFATGNDSGRIRLECIEELGNFDTPKAIARLKELRQVEDMMARGLAYISLIRLDQPPDVDELAKFFEWQDNKTSWERLGTNAYTADYLKGMILVEMEGRFNDIGRDLDPRQLECTDREYAERGNAARKAAQRWKDFDLIKFLRTARWRERGTTDVQGNASVACIIANEVDAEGVPARFSKAYRKGSRAIAVELLRSDDKEARFEAARAIDRMIIELHQFPYPQRHKPEGIDSYVAACRAWLSEHDRWAAEDR